MISPLLFLEYIVSIYGVIELSLHSGTYILYMIEKQRIVIKALFAESAFYKQLLFSVPECCLHLID